MRKFKPEKTNNNNNLNICSHNDLHATKLNKNWAIYSRWVRFAVLKKIERQICIIPFDAFAIADRITSQAVENALLSLLTIKGKKINPKISSHFHEVSFSFSQQQQ